MMRGRCVDRSLIASLLLSCLSAGCSHAVRDTWSPFGWNSRDRHRGDADDASYTIIEEKNAGTPWGLPVGFSIQTDPRSRLSDYSDPDDPELPAPGPNLYSYQLPALTVRPKRFPDLRPKQVVLPEPSPASAAVESSATAPISSDSVTPLHIEPHDSIIHTSYQEPPAVPGADQPEDDDPDNTGADGLSEYGNLDASGLRIQPIPAKYWEAIPRQCLSRILEFESGRLEYRRTFQKDPPAEFLDPSEKLTLDDVVELGRINSRDYQSQKESLYRSALALTLDRFDYQTKFTTDRNDADARFSHERSGGTTTNGLSVPSSLQVNRMLATGGTLLGRFANDVVLTFNGPDGFAADVGSEMLFNLTQSLLQRDVRLNPLIQAERNVVYSARDYARFRKQFFFNLANQYYDLLSTYRQIEIDSQNYFSLVRNFEENRAVAGSGIQGAPNQVAVDQSEQSMLGGRRGLITTCNGIERDFDGLKLTIGLPTEMPVNLDLVELEYLTRLDEIEVTGERVRRWLNRLETRRSQQPLDRGEILNASVFLVERIIEWMRLREPIEQQQLDLSPYEDLSARLLVDQSRLNSNRATLELQEARTAIPPTPPILLYQWTMNLIEKRMALLVRQVQNAERIDADRTQINATATRIRVFQKQIDSLYSRLVALLQQAQEAGQVVTLTEPIQNLRSEAEELLKQIDVVVQSTDQLIGAPEQKPAEAEALQEAITIADDLMAKSREMLESAGLGLVPLDITMDEALATALVQRLDLMNERGMLADDWRNIKLAGDDLKSVLNLKANHSIRTRDNRPFEFDLKDSSTQVNLELDLPFNRMAQRNAYRRALIEFQAGRRGLQEFEDRTIKFDIRNEMRNLELARVQYPISVAQAALAAEQVISIRLSLSLSIPNVRIPDLLDALDDSRNALISVANARIGYIVQRAAFARDLELMQLDESGFWPSIYDADYQLQPDTTYPFGAGMTYGDLPDFLKISEDIRRMQGYELPGWQQPLQPADLNADPAVVPELPEPAALVPPAQHQIQPASLSLPSPVESTRANRTGWQATKQR